MTKLKIVDVAIKDIIPYESNSRIHDKKQIELIANSITQFKFTNPVLIDKENVIIAGHGRVLGAKHLNLKTVPAIKIDYLSESEKKAYRIADNQLTIRGKWDENLLGLELKDLSEVDLNFGMEITGFETTEIDLMIENLSLDEEKAEDSIPFIDEKDIVSKPGQIWQLGKHRIICGDSTKEETYQSLMGDKKAVMALNDFPYNLAVSSFCGTGKTKHKEFKMASGEMSSEEFVTFLKTVFQHLVNHSVDGSIHDGFMDHRHIYEYLTAAKDVYSEMKNLCVWVKNNGGMGSLYRSQHELIFIHKNGTAPHINNVELGKNGRYRTNIWSYSGVNSFGKDQGNLRLHPTSKNIDMLADAILDVTKRKDIVLDAFLGGGSTLIACEKSGRVCYGIEIEPLYIDTTIKRWQEFTGKKAVLVKGGNHE